MAWIKEIENEFGDKKSYWENVKVLFDGETNLVTVSYYGYVSHQSKLDGKLPIQKSYTFNAGDAPELSGAVMAYLETKTRALPEFADSVSAEV